MRESVREEREREREGRRNKKAVRQTDTIRGKERARG